MVCAGGRLKWRQRTDTHTHQNSVDSQKEQQVKLGRCVSVCSACHFSPSPNSLFYARPLFRPCSHEKNRRRLVNVFAFLKKKNIYWNSPTRRTKESLDQTRTFTSITDATIRSKSQSKFGGSCSLLHFSLRQEREERPEGEGVSVRV